VAGVYVLGRLDNFDDPDDPGRTGNLFSSAVVRNGESNSMGYKTRLRFWAAAAGITSVYPVLSGLNAVLREKLTASKGPKTFALRLVRCLSRR
jgi:hypothetical protein